MSDTASRLRAAAEHLLLEKGQAATTLRDITERAGANVASVNYHFGSKDALLAEVFGAVLHEATAAQQAKLAELAPDAPLETVVRAWLAPALASAGRASREARLWAIIHKGMTERAPGLLQHLPSLQPLVERHLIERLAACLPQLGRDELRLRHAATLAAVAGLAGERPDALLPEPSPAGPERAADLIVAWVVGGLQAPPAASTSRPVGSRPS